MPLPALAAIPAIAAFIGAVATNFVVWIAAFFTKKFAAKALIAGVIIGAFAAMYVALNALGGALQSITPDFLSTAASWVVPSNGIACISALIAARVARTFYDYQKTIILAKA